MDGRTDVQDASVGDSTGAKYFFSPAWVLGRDLGLFVHRMVAQEEHLHEYRRQLMGKDEAKVCRTDDDDDAAASTILPCEHSCDEWSCKGSHDGDSTFSLEEEVKVKMQEASLMQAWDPAVFKLVKVLQEAPRNQGAVKLMQSIANGGGFVAVKQMPNSWMMSSAAEFSEHYASSLERPWFDVGVVRYLHAQQYPYICEPMGIFRDISSTYVMSSFASEGDLFGWLERDPPPGPEREANLRPIMHQLFIAVRWLHDFGIAHGDLSLENVLITKEDGTLKVKLIDFGMAKLSQTSLMAGGKRSYLAPEMHLRKEYDTFLADVFALGVVLFSLSAGLYPWLSTVRGKDKHFDFVAVHGLTRYVELRKVFKGTATLVDIFSSHLVVLLQGLLTIEPGKRLTLGEGCWRNEWRDSALDDMQWLNM